MLVLGHFVRFLTLTFKITTVTVPLSAMWGHQRVELPSNLRVWFYDLISSSFRDAGGDCAASYSDHSDRCVAYVAEEDGSGHGPLDVYYGYCLERGNVCTHRHTLEHLLSSGYIFSHITHKGHW